MRAHRDIFDRAHAYVEHCRRHYSGQPRRASLCLAWWGVLHGFQCAKPKSGLEGPELRVAIALEGGMGDVLLHIRYIKDLCGQCGPFSLDVYSPLSVETVRRLLGGVENLNAVRNGKIEEIYDLIICSVLIPMVVFFHKKRLELLGSPALKSYVNSLERFKARNPLWFRHQEYFMADILNYARILKISRAQLPYMTGNLQPLVDEVISLQGPGLEFPWDARPFMTISRGSGIRWESVKLWSEHKYNTLIKLLKKHFPSIALVQIGMAHDKELEVDYDLRGKTSFESLMDILQKAAVHISSEGGTVHLRHLLRGGPSVVLFGPTDPIFYGYPENCNIRTEECTPCEWIQRDWQKHCVRGFDSCRIMASTSPEFVIKKMMNHSEILNKLYKIS